MSVCMHYKPFSLYTYTCFMYIMIIDFICQNMEHSVGCTCNTFCHSLYSCQNAFQDLHYINFNHLCLMYKSCFEQCYWLCLFDKFADHLPEPMVNYTNTTTVQYPYQFGSLCENRHNAHTASHPVMSLLMWHVH